MKLSKSRTFQELNQELVNRFMDNARNALRNDKTFIIDPNPVKLTEVYQKKARAKQKGS